MKRLNKEYKLDVCSRISVKYGSVNKDDPRVIYVSGKCWVSQNGSNDCDKVMHKAELGMRKNIKLFLMDGIHFDKRFILDFDFNSDNFGVGDKKYLSFDFFLRQNERNKRPLKELKEILSSKISTVVNNLLFTLTSNDLSVCAEKKESL
jgi:hypothetical protein